MKYNVAERTLRPRLVPNRTLAGCGVSFDLLVKSPVLRGTPDPLLLVLKKEEESTALAVVLLELERNRYRERQTDR